MRENDKGGIVRGRVNEREWLGRVRREGGERGRGEREGREGGGEREVER